MTVSSISEFTQTIGAESHDMLAANERQTIFCHFKLAPNLRQTYASLWRKFIN
jgi:hypothetical protein